MHYPLMVNIYKYRLHLYDGSITPWFKGEELTTMMHKHEGRIVTIGKEEDVEVLDKN